MDSKKLNKRKNREKRPRKKPSNLKTLEKIIIKQGKSKSKFHQFLRKTGDTFLKEIQDVNDYYKPETYGVDWTLNEDFSPTPIFD